MHASGIFSRFRWSHYLAILWPGKFDCLLLVLQQHHPEAESLWLTSGSRLLYRWSWRRFGARARGFCPALQGAARERNARRVVASSSSPITCDSGCTISCKPAQSAALTPCTLQPGLRRIFVRLQLFFIRRSRGRAILPLSLCVAKTACYGHLRAAECGAPGESRLGPEPPHSNLLQPIVPNIDKTGHDKSLGASPLRLNCTREVVNSSPGERGR